MLNFSPYCFGSMSLGRNPADVRNDLAVARRAMETGIWFHSSPTYNNGFAFMVLRHAFDDNRSAVPRMVIKVRDANAQLMRFEVEDSCRRLGIDAIDVAQLVSMDPNPGNLVDQLKQGSGPIADELAALRQRGLVRSAVVFLTPGNSDAAVEAVLKSQLVEGVILYWNACQSDCSKRAWQRIQQHSIPTLALRTLGGGPSDKASSRKTAQLAELIVASGCRSATDFSLRLAASEPVVKTTIGGTASLEHLEAFLQAAHQTQPLPEPILGRALTLQQTVIE